MGELGGEERLPHPADDTSLKHRPHALQDGFEINPGGVSDLLERLALEAADHVFRETQDVGIGGVVVFGRNAHLVSIRLEEGSGSV